jgi:hypothetical protein
MLRGRGLRVTPDLFSLLAERGEERWTSGFDSPGLVVEAERLEDTPVTVRPTAVPAMLGAAAVALLAACVGWYRWPPYGLVALAVGAACAAVLWRGFAELDRRLPTAVPRSGLLGAALTAAVLIAALVALVVLRRITGL